MVSYCEWTELHAYLRANKVDKGLAGLGGECLRPRTHVQNKKTGEIVTAGLGKAVLQLYKPKMGHGQEAFLLCPSDLKHAKRQHW